MGFSDSNQKLLASHQTIYDHRHNHERPSQGELRPSSIKHARSAGYQGKNAIHSCCKNKARKSMISGLPQTDVDYVQQPQQTKLNYDQNLEMRAIRPQQPQTAAKKNQIQQQPKQVMVSNNGSGDNYHSSVASDHDQFPDLINMQQHQPQQPKSPVNHPSNAVPGKKLTQPLNPAALVVPPSPPLQFPHQFPHLIHNSGRQTASKPPPPTPPTRSYSFENQISPTHAAPQTTTAVAPLISPPAQFNQPIKDISVTKQAPPAHKGYVTLPRKLHAPPGGMAETKKGLVDWASMSERVPIYDGVGPRTSATGSIALEKPPLPPCACPIVKTSSLKRPEPKRDSSGSEVTMGDESMSGYFEPFGKAVAPPAAHLARGFVRDSIASTESDLEAILGSNPSKGQGCPLHKSHPKLQHNSTKKPEVKQLKGILKGGSMNKPVATAPSITTNPVASVVTIPQQKTVLMTTSSTTSVPTATAKNAKGLKGPSNGQQVPIIPVRTQSAVPQAKTVVVEALDV